MKQALTPFLHLVSANRTLLIFLGLIALAFITLRTKSSDIAPGDLETLVANGQPTVLEFYSNL